MQAKMKPWQLLVSLILCLVILSSVPVLRLTMGKPMIYSPDSYHSLKLSETARGCPFCPEAEDASVVPRRVAHPNTYHLLLGLFSAEGPAIIVIAHIILGMLMVAGFWLLLNELGLNKRLVLFTTLILVLSPVFVFSYTNLIPESLALVAIVWGGLLFFKGTSTKRLGLQLLSLLFFLIAISTGPWVLIGLLVLVWGFSIAKRLPKHIPILLTVLGILVFILLNFKEMFFIRPIGPVRVVSSIVFEFGGPMGFSFFSVVLGIVGLLATWKKYRELVGIYFFSFLILVGMFLFGVSPLLFIIVLPFFCGYMVRLLVDKVWVLPPLKIITIIIAVLGLVFSTVIAVGTEILAEPDGSMDEGIGFLKEQQNSGSVFSIGEYGSLISQATGKPVVLDHLVNNRTVLNETDAIFWSRNLERTKRLMDRYSIAYLFITPKMATGNPWSEEDDGLLFLLRNNQTFRNLYAKDGVEIWGIIKN